MQPENINKYYLEMVIFLLLHNLFVLTLFKGVIIAKEISKNFLAPVSKRTTMMLIFFRINP